MRIKIISENPKETQKIAFYLAKYLNYYYQERRKGALVISLEGTLGSGKTEFMKGVGKALKLKETVFSPTFLLMKRFPLRGSYFRFLWHLDCYRLQNKKELQNLDLEGIFSSSQNIVFIEWGDKISSLLPARHWKIKFMIKGEKERILIFDIHFNNEKISTY